MKVLVPKGIKLVAIYSLKEK